MHALVVEDVPELLAGYESWLLMLGCETVRGVSSLSAAVDLLNEVPPPDILIVDVMVADSAPDWDGSHFARVARLTGHWPNVAIVAVSGIVDADGEAARRVERSGGVFLGKPVRFADFRAAVTRARALGRGWSPDPVTVARVDACSRCKGASCAG